MKASIIALCLAAAAGSFGSPGHARPGGSIEYLGIPTPLRGAMQPKYPDNCVGFIRNDMGVRLPNVNLTSWAAKQGIVNWRGDPRYGDVAIIAVPTGEAAANGHIALVQEVTATSITIVEANFRKGQVTMRRATGRNLADAAAQLRIYGYYRP